MREPAGGKPQAGSSDLNSAGTLRLVLMLADRLREGLACAASHDGVGASSVRAVGS